MWQKVNPKSFRLKTTTTWDSQWYASPKKMWDLFLEDKEIRDFINNKLPDSWISKIMIFRSSSKVNIEIYTSKPWVIIWRQWSQIDEIKKTLDRKYSRNFDINVKELKTPDLESAIVASNIARAVERRIAYRRAIKQAISRSVEAWAIWIKVYIWWRLNWAEIARGEFYKEWNIPLHTIRSDVSYAIERANTVYWVLWIKVWIYRWEVFNKKSNKLD